MSEITFENLPKRLQDALLRCDALAGPEQLDYFYELYDPKTGGFYYSISSRDAEEMTPFAEGTSFVLEALEYGGMTPPDWYKEKASKWILNHQDESDGFFYEELWGKITSASRINRDLSYSKDILHICGVKPLYPLPEERIKAGASSSSQSAGFPEYLESEEKMKEYLDSLDWTTKSIWSTGQKLTTAKNLIKAAGLFEFVHDHIVKKQNPDTGLWGGGSDAEGDGDGYDWMNTNGAMKLSGFFGDEAHPYPNPELAIESIKKIYSGEKPPTQATWTWNPFVLLRAILNSNASRAEELRSLLYDVGADIVNRAVDCALKMKRDDGGFASGFNGATPRQQGYLFGYGTKTESDLDGTLIAGPRLRNYIWYAFGLKSSRDYYADKNDGFWERCRNKPEVVKTLPRPEGPLNPTWQPEPKYKPVW